MSLLKSLFKPGVGGGSYPRSRGDNTKGSMGRGERRRNRQKAIEGGKPDNSADIEKRGMDDTHFASGMPTEHQGLADKLDSHQSGTLFKYAVIANKPSEERKGLLSKLRSYKPQTKVKALTLNDIPAIRLVGDCTEMSLSQVLDPDLLRDEGDFVLIDCVLVHFVPLDSFANDKSVVTIQINDFRKITNTTVRTARVDNTMGYNILFFLDYCIEKRDFDRMVLSFTCGTKEFQEGVAWGTAKVIVQLQFLSFPRRMPLLDTMGVVLLSDTDLQEFECDPREIDLVLTPEVIKRLKQAKSRGEIENRTVAQDDLKPIVTARTVLGDDYQESEVGSMVSKMKEVALLNERQKMAKASVRNKLKSLAEGHQGSTDSSVPVVALDVLDGTRIKEDLDNRDAEEMKALEGLSEVSVGESRTGALDSQSEVEEGLKNVKGGERVKFAD